MRIVILSERKVTRGCPPLNAEALEVGLQAQQGFILCVPPHERKAVLMVHDLSIGTAFLFKKKEKGKYFRPEKFHFLWNRGKYWTDKGLELKGIKGAKY